MVAPALFQFNPVAMPGGSNNIGIPIPWDPGATAVSGAGAAVALTFTPAEPNDFVEIGQIDFSYSGAPTGGGITITDGGTTVWQCDLSTAGPASIMFTQPRMSRAKGNTVVVTLAGGGGGLVGKLNVHAWVRQ